MSRFIRTSWLGFGDETGTVTIFGLMLLLVTLTIGGLAVDVSNAYRMRSHLQVAGDAAAHAALVIREHHSLSEAKSKALDIANRSLPSVTNGDVLRMQDVYFGSWDTSTQKFTPDAGSTNAVLVDTGRLSSRGNSISTYLLQLAGVREWNVRRQSVFVTYKPTCFREGLVAEELINATSGNTFTSGFCVHSNTAVSFSNDNYFETGAIVSMPDRRDVILPSGGLDKNDGLSAALRDGAYHLKILDRIDDIISGVRDPNSEYYRDWIDPSFVEVNLNRNDKLDETKFLAGRINTIWCNNPNQSTSIHNGTELKDVVIVTNCQLALGQDAKLENVMIANMNTSANSISGASGVRLGRDDSCGAGGGVQIVTKGGVNFPSALQIYGTQIIAAGDVSYTSDADGSQGASIISGGTLDGTTNSILGFCGGAGMESNFEALYFRMAY